MTLFAALIEFDAALEWPLDDSLLADDPPSGVTPDGGAPSPLPSSRSASHAQLTT